ncbi:MAG: fluoride efflux transporter CrcB [Hyphomonadaceae bacterium]|nr:fluoride efflux transporter CrcB [Hyphomonadaceae bacterium]
MQNLVLVALGGALGALSRYGVGVLMLRIGFVGFPWSTLFVNVTGGFAMGLLAGWLGEGGPALRLLLGVGFLGGFTTFSAYSLDALRLLEEQRFAEAFGYIALSVILSIGACWLGLMLARQAA